MESHGSTDFWIDFFLEAGLEKNYAEAYAHEFRKNHITQELAGTLGDHDLEKLGVKSLGHRKLILREAQLMARATGHPHAHAQARGLDEPFMPPPHLMHDIPPGYATHPLPHGQAQVAPMGAMPTSAYSSGFVPQYYPNVQQAIVESKQARNQLKLQKKQTKNQFKVHKKQQRQAAKMSKYHGHGQAYAAYPEYGPPVMGPPMGASPMGPPPMGHPGYP